MTSFWLLRHGETDWQLAGERRLIGAANDLVPLTHRGIEQIESAAVTLRQSAPQLILTSPMTRALQSAAILSRALDLPRYPRSCPLPQRIWSAPWPRLASAAFIY
ncbi:MAG: histidine phosphatase family protein [Chloroflexi bacterium]|nr:histidine phosphatase family protein [Chloroflexota bacterium]